MITPEQAETARKLHGLIPIRTIYKKVFGFTDKEIEEVLKQKMEEEVQNDYEVREAIKRKYMRENDLEQPNELEAGEEDAD